MNKLSCLKDPQHNRFSASAHVTEDWVVDGHGNWLESDIGGDVQVVSGPCFDVSVCMECGAETVKEDE